MSDNFVFWCSVAIGIAFLAMFVAIRNKEGYAKFLPLCCTLLFFFLVPSIHLYERFYVSSWWIPVGSLCIFVILLYSFWISLSMSVENNQARHKMESKRGGSDSVKENLDISDKKPSNVSRINPTRET